MLATPFNMEASENSDVEDEFSSMEVDESEDEEGAEFKF